MELTSEEINALEQSREKETQAAWRDPPDMVSDC